jgi:hypothetical protein
VRRNKFWNDHIANQCSNTPLALGEEVGQLGLGGFGKVTRVGLFGDRAFGPEGCAQFTIHLE